jgi:hypothetical protein
MPTPKTGYFLKSGEKCPGTTTLISAHLGWNKQQLMWWANKEGQSGRNHRESADKAADIGTQAHAMVEAHIKGEPLPGGISTKAFAAYEEYLEWQRRTQIEIVGSEIALVHEELRYGSTLDAMGKFDGEYELLDWKSSNGCYADHVIQLAAYWKNWEFNNPDKPVRRIHLCRFGKEGGFHHHSWKPLDLLPAWKVFVNILDLNSLKRNVEALV